MVHIFAGYSQHQLSQMTTKTGAISQSHSFIGISRGFSVLLGRINL